MNQVGRYQILEELGRGAMGTVYKALDPAIGRTVAIKAIRLADLIDPDERQRIRERLLREAQSAGLLSHPNIVTIYDVLEEADYAYIFMEYVSGPSLEDMLRTGTLPESAGLLHFLRQVANALDYAHRKGIVHRDIKPANIIISEPGPGSERVAKIADFGVAKFVSHEMTHSGTMIGTPNYMSPEQIEGGVVSGASDQFSLGVVVYELLTGERPFSGANLPALFYSICKQEPAPVEQVNTTLNEIVDKTLQKALAKTAASRFSSCSDFIGALSIALGDSPGWTPLPRRSGVASGGALDETVPGNGRPARAREPGPIVIASPIDSSAANAAVTTAAATTAAPPLSQEGPPAAATRRRRLDEEAEAAASPYHTSAGKKLGLILAMVFAIIAAIVFIVRSNSGPNIPVQVLDTNSGPVAPPPQDLGSAGSPQDLGSGSTASGASANSHVSSSPQLKPAQNPARAGSIPTHPGASGSTAPEGPLIADVDLLSEPPGAKLVVDNNPETSCTSPCTLSLPAGRHTLTADLDGYNVARRIFNVPQDSSLLVPLSKSTGTLLVTSVPSGAVVSVDGSEVGRTPWTLRLAPGEHRIEVMNGQGKQEQTVVIQADTLQARNFRF